MVRYCVQSPYSLKVRMVSRDKRKNNWEEGFFKKKKRRRRLGEERSPVLRIHLPNWDMGPNLVREPDPYAMGQLSSAEATESVCSELIPYNVESRSGV